MLVPTLITAIISVLSFFTIGKTTTSLLIHHILKKAGFDVALSGNIGQSYARQVAKEDREWYVLELSSFQLDDMNDFKANVAVLTNITADHLDRYDYKIENYIQSKFRIINNLSADDWFIYNADDDVIMKELATKKIIQMERVDHFRSVFKDPDFFFCLFTLSDLGAQFIFLPRD